MLCSGANPSRDERTCRHAGKEAEGHELRLVPKDPAQPQAVVLGQNVFVIIACYTVVVVCIAAAFVALSLSDEPSEDKDNEASPSPPPPSSLSLSFLDLNSCFKSVRRRQP